MKLIKTTYLVKESKIRVTFGEVGRAASSSFLESFDNSEVFQILVPALLKPQKCLKLIGTVLGINL